MELWENLLFGRREIKARLDRRRRKSECGWRFAHNADGRQTIDCWFLFVFSDGLRFWGTSLSVQYSLRLDEKKVDGNRRSAGEGRKGVNEPL